MKAKKIQEGSQLRSKEYFPSCQGGEWESSVLLGKRGLKAVIFLHSKHPSMDRPYCLISSDSTENWYSDRVIILCLSAIQGSVFHSFPQAIWKLR